MGEIEGKRIKQLDIAKGIGIIMVVLGHSLPSDSFLRLIIYSFHMPLFFFLSGLTLKKARIDDTFKDIVKSEYKLFVTYLFYTFVFLLFDIVVRFCVLQDIGILSVVSNCYQAVVMFGINVLWFLSSLLFGKIIVKSIVKKKLNTNTYIVIIILLFFVPSVISLLLHNPTNGLERLFWYPIVGAFRSLVASSFIAAGHLCKERNIYSKILGEGYSKKVLLLIISLIVIVLGCYLTYIENLKIDLHLMKMGKVTITFFTSYLGIFSVLILANEINKICIIKMFYSFWGCNSLFVMVTHEYFLMRRLFKFVLESFGILISETLSPYVFTILTLIVEIPLIFLFSKKANKIIDYLYKKKFYLWK